MKHYIVLDGKKTNDYVRGRINGMIYVLTGMPDISYGFAWKVTEDLDHWTTAFEGDEEVLQTVVDVIDTLYPDVILKVKSFGSNQDGES